MNNVPRLGAALLIVALAGGAAASPPPSEAPEGGTAVQTEVEVSERVRRIIEAPYLTEDEARTLRIQHGAWSGDDLATASDRARAAVIAGVWDDPSLENPDANTLDRAEAALTRGEIELAMELTPADSDEPGRAGWIRARALYDAGRLADAQEVAEVVTQDLLRRRLEGASEIAFGVRTANLLIRLRGPESNADFQGMLALLNEARDADRAAWMPPLVEAEILSERGARAEAQAAVMESLRLNPRLARAWRVLAEMQIDTFGFDQAQSIREELNEAARSVTGSEDESVEGTLAVARGRLRLSDAAGAEELIEPVLERLPLCRDALALHAAAAARGFDWDETEARVERFAELSPGSAAAVLAVGQTLSDARQYAESSDFLNRAVEMEPNIAEAWTALGLLELQWGRDVPAADALQNAVELDPFHLRADNSLRLVRELLTYDTVESEHFTIRYRPGVDEVLAREMPVLLERMHERVTGDLPGGIDHEPSEKTLIELMPDHAWFSVRITGMPQIWTVAAATGRVVAMESPKSGAGSSVGPYDWFRVVQHEYAHTVTLSRTNNRIPHWFTEAAAVHLEDAPRDEQRSRLLAGKLAATLEGKSAADGGLFTLEEINLGFIRPTTQDSRPLAYAQGHWMYEYVIDTYGREAPLALMDEYAKGATEAEAFGEVLGVTPDEFFAGFLESAQSQVVSWGLALADGVPDIDTLRLRTATELARAERGKADQAPTALDIFKGEAEPEPVAPVEVTEDWVAERLQEYPRHPELLALMVRYALEANGGRATASMIPLLESYAAAVPVAQTPHRLLAELYLDGRGRAVERDELAAIPHLEFLDARETYSAAYAIELARKYADLGMWNEAQAKSERAVRIGPFEPEYREFAARVAIRTRAWDDAERHLEALVKIEPGVSRHQQRLEKLRELRDRAS